MRNNLIDYRSSELAAAPYTRSLEQFGETRNGSSKSGSDYLNVAELDNGALRVVLADLRGSESSVSLMRTVLHSVVRMLASSRESRSLLGSADLLNDVFYEISPDCCYATALLLSFDAERGEMRYVSAGHEPTLMIRSKNGERTAISLDGGGPVVGLFRKPSFHERSIKLLEGDVIAAYTDGLSEAMAPSGEQWGYRRLVESIRRNADDSARGIAENVIADVTQFIGSEPQFDDRTLWVARIPERGLSVTRVAETKISRELPPVIAHATCA